MPVFKSSSNRTKNNKEQIKQDVRFQSSQVQTEQKNTMSFKLLPIKLSSNDDPTLMERDEDGRDFVILGDGAAGFLYEGHRIDHIPSCPELALEMMGRVKRGDGKLLCGSITTKDGLIKSISKGALWKFSNDEGLFDVGACFYQIREAIKDAAKREERPKKRRKVERDLDGETDDEDYDATERLFDSKGTIIPLNGGASDD